MYAQPCMNNLTKPSKVAVNIIGKKQTTVQCIVASLKILNNLSSMIC